jgi:hypothetical protein
LDFTCPCISDTYLSCALSRRVARSRTCPAVSLFRGSTTEHAKTSVGSLGVPCLRRKDVVAHIDNQCRSGHVVCGGLAQLFSSKPFLGCDVVEVDGKATLGPASPPRGTYLPRHQSPQSRLRFSSLAHFTYTVSFSTGKIPTTLLASSYLLLKRAPV